jgi:hypothetical protein
MMAQPVACGRATTAPLPRSSLGHGYDHARNRRDLNQYFEDSSHGIDATEVGLKELPFGEFLVEQAVVDRFELFRALQMQDRIRGVPIGECIAALGYAPTGVIEQMYVTFAGIKTVTVE